MIFTRIIRLRRRVIMWSRKTTGRNIHLMEIEKLMWHLAEIKPVFLEKRQGRYPGWNMGTL